jgi:hypothetical protein
MLTFKEFVSELARHEVTLPAEDVAEMTRRFGEKTLQMGHLREDGSLAIPVECILEAARALGDRQFAEAAESINNDRIASLLKSAEAFVEHVGRARESRLRNMIRGFQNEPDVEESHQQWKEIEKEIFGVDYHD